MTTSSRVKAAVLCGARLAFILPDGSQLILAPDEK